MTITGIESTIDHTLDQSGGNVRAESRADSGRSLGEAHLLLDFVFLYIALSLEYEITTNALNRIRA